MLLWPHAHTRARPPSIHPLFHSWNQVKSPLIPHVSSHMWGLISYLFWMKLSVPGYWAGCFTDGPLIPSRGLIRSARRRLSSGNFPSTDLVLTVWSTSILIWFHAAAPAEMTLQWLFSDPHDLLLALYAHRPQSHISAHNKPDTCRFHQPLPHARLILMIQR